MSGALTMDKGTGNNIPIGGGRRAPPFSLRLTQDERADLAVAISATLRLAGRKAAYRKQMRRAHEQERQQRRKRRGPGPAR